MSAEVIRLMDVPEFVAAIRHENRAREETSPEYAGKHRRFAKTLRHRIAARVANGGGRELQFSAPWWDA